MNLNTLILKEENEILYIIINRPDKLNALNGEVMEELKDVFDYFEKEKGNKICIITGSGEKSFVAGADISGFQNLSPEQAKQLAQKGQELFLQIESCPKLIIALVNGFALGGGCELAMACHIRIATPNAKFSQPEINLGILPGYGGTVRLPKIIGLSKSIELLLTGDMIDAQQALQLGLVSEVLEPKEALAKALSIAEKVKSKSPLVVEKILGLLTSQDTQAYNEEAQYFGACFYTEDTKEGVQAFLEKRKPQFKGK